MALCWKGLPCPVIFRQRPDSALAIPAAFSNYLASDNHGQTLAARRTLAFMRYGPKRRFIVFSHIVVRSMLFTPKNRHSWARDVLDNLVAHRPSLRGSRSAASTARTTGQRSTSRGEVMLNGWFRLNMASRSRWRFTRRPRLQASPSSGPRIRYASCCRSVRAPERTPPRG